MKCKRIGCLRPIETRQGWSREKVEDYNRARIQSVLDADFDLLIIDECHKVGGGSQTVGRYVMADILCNAIPNVLLLSATPHRGKSDHFRRILGLLDADFTSTQRMLQRILSEKGGYPCCIINGSMDFEQRVEALRQFKENAQILISTDAAGESLNMQFAHIVINYDMPWNPMVVEQRIGRVDRIGQNHKVLALNFLLDNSVDKRVYEVVEIKLNQILNEMGIDKTSDVLDSTIERDGLQRLYLTSLLNPEKFEAESADWLTDIRQKLAHYKSTEGALPTLTSGEIRKDKTDAIQYSPLPEWLELLSKHYLTAKNIPFTNLLDGMKFKFPGTKEQIYTFNMRESMNNPIPEPLSLQHEIIVQMMSEAVPFNGQQRIQFELHQDNTDKRLLIIVPNDYFPMPDMEHSAHFLQINLSDLFLYKKGLISEDIWTAWFSGIKSNLRIEEVKNVWVKETKKEGANESYYGLPKKIGLVWRT